MDKFKSLYIINKQAKNYQKEQTELSSARADALYQLKHRFIQDNYYEFEKIEIHHIKDTKHYCFYINDYSYHIPKSVVNIDIPYEKTQTLPNFEKSMKPISKDTERKALEHFHQNCNYNVNNYLHNDAPPQSFWGFLPIH